MTTRIDKTDAQWKKELGDEQYRVCREKGTEPAFSGEYWDAGDVGMYHCSCCGAVLFDSQTKFDSGTGWPSFFAPADERAVAIETDNGQAMVRTEVLCRACGAHLGHRFDDGPVPTGRRYCINSVSLRLKPR